MSSRGWESATGKTSRPPSTCRSKRPAIPVLSITSQSMFEDRSWQNLAIVKPAKIVLPSREFHPSHRCSFHHGRAEASAPRLPPSTRKRESLWSPGEFSGGTALPAMAASTARALSPEWPDAPNSPIPECPESPDRRFSPETAPRLARHNRCNDRRSPPLTLLRERRLSTACLRDTPGRRSESGCLKTGILR
jgi:hypothetical protein